jgi:uncharacterized LabA/DUF88 family protein
MPETPDAERKLAMLIDGDNAQYKLVGQMLEEASRYGTVTIRRAYGDWAQPNLAPWLQRMSENAIRPIQQSRNTTGKNATDSALIIDAMDILYADTVQGFCIVSSDGDFTGLCTRIRESGLFVMGMGHKQTPNSFIQACDVFIYVENLTDATTTSEVATEDQTSSAKPEPENGAKLRVLAMRAFAIAPSEDGWVHLGAFGQVLKRLDPSFDSRTYGQKSLSLLVKAKPELFVVRAKKKNDPSSIYVRLKKG